MRKLVIISHTEHYKKPDGSIVGLGSTITEINHLLEVFDEIVHVAMLHNSIAPPSALPYTSNKITFIPIPALGGKSMSSKLGVISKSPLVLRTVQKALRNSDVFQFRAPTGIGTYIIPYLMFFSSKNGWFKYAGNWKQKNAPLAYRFQRWLLKKQKRIVTINGKWPDQPKQCLTFENPCLSLSDVQNGKLHIQSKSLTNNAIELCFVGSTRRREGIRLIYLCTSEIG